MSGSPSGGWRLAARRRGSDQLSSNLLRDRVQRCEGRQQLSPLYLLSPSRGSRCRQPWLWRSSKHFHYLKPKRLELSSFHNIRWMPLFTLYSSVGDTALTSTEYHQNNWVGQKSSRCRDRGAEHLENTSAGRSFVQTEVMPVKSPGKPPTSVAALFAPHLLQLRTTRWLNILTSDSHIFAHLILAPALKISKLFV